MEARGVLNPKGCHGGWEGGGRAVTSGPCGLWRFWWGPQRAKERKQRNNVPVEHRRKIFSPNFSGREPICHCCEPVEWVLLSSGGSWDRCFPPGYGKPDCTSTNQSEASLPETVIGNDVTGWDFPSAFKAVSSSRLQPATKIYRAAVSVGGRAAPARPVLIPTSETRSWVCETHGWTGIDANFCVLKPVAQALEKWVIVVVSPPVGLCYLFCKASK